MRVSSGGCVTLSAGVAGLQIFLREKVDTAVLEVGLGGRLDATNVVREPYVCGITSLGYDHMEILGHTLPEIAAEKAGILKKGAPAFTVQQPADAMKVLQVTPCLPCVTVRRSCPICTTAAAACGSLAVGERLCALLQDKAREVGTSLSVAPPLEEYAGGADLDLGLAGQHQRINAALAVTLAAAWEARHAQVLSAAMTLAWEHPCFHFTCSLT